MSASSEGGAGGSVGGSAGGTATTTAPGMYFKIYLQCTFVYMYENICTNVHMYIIYMLALVCIHNIFALCNSTCTCVRVCQCVLVGSLLCSHTRAVFVTSFSFVSHS